MGKLPCFEITWNVDSFLLLFVWPTTQPATRPTQWLGGILDGLSEGLNEAVATVVKDAVEIAVREAVQAVFNEVLTNPVILAKLLPQPQAAPSGPPRITLGQRLAGLWQGVKARCHKMGQGIGQGFQRVGAFFGTLGRGFGRAVGKVWQACHPLALFKGPLIIALGIGIIAGVGAYCAGPWLAALVSGLGAFLTTLAVQIGWWLRRALSHLTTAFE